MTTWPDAEEKLLRRYAAQLDLRDSPFARRPYESVLRRFQRFAAKHAADQPLNAGTVAAWLQERVQVSSLRMAICRAQIVSRFLDWLVGGGHLAVNPIAELRKGCRRDSTAAIVRAMVGPAPAESLRKLRGLPRFGSHLGPAIQEHVERMQNLGFRYDEKRFRRFDEFLQTRPGAEAQPLHVLVKEYAALAPSPAGHMERVKIGRVLAKSLRRVDPKAQTPERDHMVAREVVRQRLKPHIFTMEEIRKLLSAALEFPSPNAPLRPLTLYTMLVLAYCAGLRMGELVHLCVGDVRHGEDSIDIRESKFFKSRRLPLAPSTMAVLRDYLEARGKASLPNHPEAALFWHKKGSYAYITANHLLRRVIRHAGLKPQPGRIGPRIHDLRHTFVVHRMMAWYREGVNPQAKLPYLWTYLGHRDLHSSLVYMTITRELLQSASDRFRALGAKMLGDHRTDENN